MGEQNLVVETALMRATVCVLRETETERDRDRETDSDGYLDS